MTHERAIELLNEIVNTKVEEAGLDAREAAAELIRMGFSVEELMQDFEFDADDLEDLCPSGDDEEED